MKRFLFLGLLLILTSIMAMAEGVQAYLSYSIFNTPDNEPYIETYLVVNGKTLKHVELEDGTYQSVIDIQIIFRKNDSIINFGKYELLGPNVADTTKTSSNLLDVQRYALPQGEYQLEFSLNDRYGVQDTVVSFDSFKVDFSSSGMVFSDIEFLHSYSKSDNDGVLTKSGFELVPYVFNYFPEAVNNLSFYSELYNSESVLNNDQFLLYYYIRPYEVDKKLDQFFYMKKLTGANINILLNSIDISQLPSGNYYMVLETRDRNNEILSTKKKYFQRYNPNTQFNLTNLLVLDPRNTFAGKITSRDSLVLYIDYLYPISTSAEKDFAKSMVKESGVEDLQKYFLNFWTERDRSNPEAAWNEYKYRVAQANADFKSIRIMGYRTDRGRVYLEYGDPNVMTPSHNEPAAYPYEIWHYYVLKGQQNKKFVFYTKDIVTNDFQLIHSNAVGELANYKWQNFIYSRTWDPYSIDDSVIPDTYGSFATDYYLQPR